MLKETWLKRNWEWTNKEKWKRKYKNNVNESKNRKEKLWNETNLWKKVWRRDTLKEKRKRKNEN